MSKSTVLCTCNEKEQDGLVQNHKLESLLDPNKVNNKMHKMYSYFL